MRPKLFFTLLLIVLTDLHAQTQDAWVYFADKPMAPTFIESPLMMLSQRALDRRERQHISLDFKDVPIEASYIEQVKAAPGISVLARSKWLNALHLQGTESAVKNLLNLSFVASVDFADKTLNANGRQALPRAKPSHLDKWALHTDLDYGLATNQIDMLKGGALHQRGFTGAGIQIAVIDAGFPQVDTHTAFDRMRSKQQLLGGYDFVNRSHNYFTGNYHGMAVLSTMAGYLEGQFVGTAPDAAYYLFITEDVNRETPLEESLWAEAAEKADSLGVDLINTSLGYATFDDPRYNYSYAAMDGRTTFISRAAEIAFSRGMLLVNSAGNEGSSTWHYITAPADAAAVLSIGAVDASEVVAAFSSFGPTVDARVKPDVCAQGAGTSIINADGNIIGGNGTSFSSPVLAGVLACLWQAFPQETNAVIGLAVKHSGHLFEYPTDQEGYGIPDFERAYQALLTQTADRRTMRLSPNPTNHLLTVSFPDDTDAIEFVIYNLLGQQQRAGVVTKEQPFIVVNDLVTGLYMVALDMGTKTEVINIVKK
ncbi:MAG: S8 family serine peptidase [Lutibacter sp.]|jgi:subtilisin family serine protease|nr:S8 family serine peptidase [Lutibacter sp.]